MKKRFQGLTASLALAALPPVLGSSFLYGYCLGVINVPQTVLGLWVRRVKCSREEFGLENQTTNVWCQNLTAKEEETMFATNSELNMIWVLISSVFCLGGLIEAMLTAQLVNRFGRKGTLLLNNISGIAGGVLQFMSSLTNSYEMLIVGRFVMGLNSGISLAVPPVYLTEIVPTSFRGCFGCLHQLFITLGILISQIIGLPYIFGSKEDWPYLFLFGLIPCGIQLLILPFCPESPKFLYLVRKNEIKARKVLMYLRRTSNVQEEINEIAVELGEMKLGHAKTVSDLWNDRFLRSVTVVAVVIMAAQQFSGINAIVFYSTSIFKSAGMLGISAVYATIGTGSTQVVMTVVSLILVERAGRRTLLLCGYGGMFIIASCLTAFMLVHRYNGSEHTEGVNDGGSFHWSAPASVVAVYIFICMFAIGPGSVSPFLVAEMFSQGPRAVASSLAVAANRLANLVVALCFPLLQASIGEYTFIVFVVLLALCFLYTARKVPETKGKEIDAIHAELRQRL